MVILLGANTGLSRIMYSPLPAIHPLQPQFITTAIQLHPGILVCLWTRVLNPASTRRGANNKDGGLPESSGYCAIGGNSTNPKRKKSAKREHVRPNANPKPLEEVLVIGFWPCTALDVAKKTLLYIRRGYRGLLKQKHEWAFVGPGCST